MSESWVATPSSANKPQQGRVGPLVVDDEAGVHADHGAARIFEVVGVGVAAESVVGLEQRDVGRLLQDVGGGQAGDAATDDGNPPATAGSWSNRS